MNLTPLPTPRQVFKGFTDVLQAVLFALALGVVFSGIFQFVLIVLAVVLVLFHHWIIGLILGVIVLAARSIRSGM